MIRVLCLLLSTELVSAPFGAISQGDRSSSGSRDISECWHGEQSSVGGTLIRHHHDDAPRLGASAVDNRSVTDVDEGSRESRELEGQVAAAFRAPKSLGSLPADGRRRPLLLLSERPSFGNYRCWAVWGPHEVVGHPNRDAIVRRIVWRRDLDGDPSDPMRRLQRLGQPLSPSLEIVDAIIDAAKLDLLMDAGPPLKTQRRQCSILGLLRSTVSGIDLRLTVGRGAGYLNGLGSTGTGHRQPWTTLRLPPGPGSYATSWMLWPRLMAQRSTLRNVN